MEKTLKEKTTVALTWSFIDKFGQQIVYLVTGIFLGRLLSPDDYGLTGSLLFFIAVSTILVGSGYGRALMNQPELKDKELSTVFYYYIFMGLFLYILLFFSAPLISRFFDEPLLILLSRVLFLNIIFTSLLNVHELILIKKLDLNNLAKANIYALTPASILAVLAAFNGFGVWALVIQSVLFTCLKMILFRHYSKWKPKRIFDVKILRELLPFSSRVLVINLVNTIANNIYYIIIGRYYNITQLGFFTQANKYQDIPTGLINNTFRSVSMPLLSGVNEDKERLKRVLRKLIRTIAFIAFPLLLGMILIAKPLFIVLITEKWLPSVPVFQILCLSGLFLVFNNVLQESILSKGRSRGLLVVEILKKSVLILLIFVTIRRGLEGLATGWAISWFISLVLSLYLSWRIIGYSILDFIKDSFPYFAISGVLCSIAWFISRPIENNVLFLGVCITFVGSFYLIFCRLFKLDATMEMFIWLRQKVKLHDHHNE